MHVAWSGRVAEVRAHPLGGGNHKIKHRMSECKRINQRRHRRGRVVPPIPATRSWAAWLCKPACRRVIERSCWNRKVTGRPNDHARGRQRLRAGKSCMKAGGGGESRDAHDTQCGRWKQWHSLARRCDRGARSAVKSALLTFSFVRFGLCFSGAGSVFKNKNKMKNKKSRDVAGCDPIGRRLTKLFSLPSNIFHFSFLQFFWWSS